MNEEAKKEKNTLTLDLDNGLDKYQHAINGLVKTIKTKYKTNDDDAKAAVDAIVVQILDFITRTVSPTLREGAALFGAVTGLAVSAYIFEEKAKEEDTHELVEIFAVSMKETITASLETMEQIKRVH